MVQYRFSNGSEASNNDEEFEASRGKLSLDDISVVTDAVDVEVSDSSTGSASNSHHSGSSHFDAEEVERRRKTSDLFLSFLRNDHGVVSLLVEQDLGNLHY